MKHLKKYESFTMGIKPMKKYPTGKAIHLNSIIQLLESKGLNTNNLSGSRGGGIQDFFFEKCSLDVVYPLNKEQSIYNDNRYEKFIFGESVILIPIKYDSSNDMSDNIEKKLSFLQKMKDNYKKIYPKKTEKELEKSLEDLEKNVNFGPEGYEWINPSLKIIHEEYSQYYEDGKLRVWFPKDTDYDPWVGYDFPHKYNVVGDLDRPDGVYYLSDIEKYIFNKYDIKDDNFYDYIIKNEYIEGRYWERVWSLSIDEENPKKFQRKGGRYGMDATENINHILNIIEKDFSDDFKSSEYEGFTIYIDYYKKVTMN